MAHMTSNVPITIVGGGLAGLCLANALNTVGINVEVFEAALELNEIGAAVNISPNATCVLQALRLNDEIEAAGDHGAGLFNRNMQTGDPIDTGKPKNGPAAWSSTQFRFHRADLLGILAKNVDPNSIRLGHRLISATEYSDRVELTFSNGVTHDAKFVVGADGIRSLLRQTLYGDDNPSYTGQMVWRTLLPGSDVPPELLEPTGQIQWLGPGRHFLAYFIRRGELVNVVTQQDTSEWVDEGWSMPGDPDEMRLSFPNPEPRLAKILGLVTECSKWGLFTRPITENWGHGRIQLIGDGDLSAGISAAVRGSGVHAVIGTGGAPEGVLVAAAMRCLNGEILARLVVDTPEKEERCRAMGITDMNRVYRSTDLASGTQLVFAATGVTDGTLMKGVRFFGDGVRTSSLVMQTNPRRIQFIDTLRLREGSNVKIQF